MTSILQTSKWGFREQLTDSSSEDRVSLHSLTDLKFMALLPMPSEYWDYRPVLLCLTHKDSQQDSRLPRVYEGT